MDATQWSSAFERLSERAAAATPAILVAVGLLLFGWVLAYSCRFLAKRLLGHIAERIESRFDIHTARTPRSGLWRTGPQVLGEGVFWVILAFVSAAAIEKLPVPMVAESARNLAYFPTQGPVGRDHRVRWNRSRQLGAPPNCPPVRFCRFRASGDFGPTGPRKHHRGCCGNWRPTTGIGNGRVHVAGHRRCRRGLGGHGTRVRHRVGTGRSEHHGLALRREGAGDRDGCQGWKHIRDGSGNHDDHDRPRHKRRPHPRSCEEVLRGVLRGGRAGAVSGAVDMLAAVHIERHPEDSARILERHESRRRGESPRAGVVRPCGWRTRTHGA